MRLSRPTAHDCGCRAFEEVVGWIFNSWRWDFGNRELEMNECTEPVFLLDVSAISRQPLTVLL